MRRHLDLLQDVAFALVEAVVTIGFFALLALWALSVCSGCGGIVADDDPDANETSPDAETVILPDGDECTESACAEACVAGGYIDGYCVGLTCFCVPDTRDADAGPEVEDAGVEDVEPEVEGAGPDEVAEEDAGPEVESVEEDVGVEDGWADEVEDATEEDVVEETEDGSTRMCLETPEGGHTDFETGSITPFEPDLGCLIPGAIQPAADRSRAYNGSMSMRVSALPGCAAQHIYYPLGNTRMSARVLIPDASHWSPCASTPCTEAELGQGPTVQGFVFRRDGTVRVGTGVAMWEPNTWHLIEFDYSCVGTTGTYTVYRFDEVVLYERYVPDSGTACPPDRLSTWMMASVAPFWVDDYCVEALE